MNPLLDLHRQSEAELQRYGDIEIVSTFGEPQAEYAAIRKSCGMMDLPQRGLIEVTGRDRLTFLNSLLTSELVNRETKQPIPAGESRYAFLLDAKTGKIKTDLMVINLDQRVLLDVELRLLEATLAHFERFVFSEQVTFRSLAAELHQIALIGPGSGQVAAGGELIRWVDDSCGVVGSRLAISLPALRQTWMNLLTTVGQSQVEGKRALRPVGWAAFNTCRIEAGRPLFGIDFDDTNLPAETGQLDRAVSFTKGCYPGQEIVARMHARQQVSKRVVGFRMIEPQLPIAGAPVQDDQGNTVGGVTSSTISPVLSNAAIGLALVKRSHMAVGSRLTIPAEGKLSGATVVELPFVK
jgi:folate-binding protein YgfZ